MIIRSRKGIPMLLKELVLVPRVMLGVLYVAIGVFAVSDGHFYGVLFLALVFLCFVLSFLWQYLILHPMLWSSGEKGWRWPVIKAWMFLAFVFGVWSLFRLANFDWLQDESEVVPNFVREMIMYVIEVSLFVAGACARRAFQMHGAL